MAVTIVAKGESAQLRGKNTVSRALVGLGWNPNEGQSSHDFDLDASAVARDAKGDSVAVCYYADKTPTPYMKHHGDNLTGAGDGDDEQIEIDLSQVPAGVDRIDLVVHIYEAGSRKQNFGMVESSFVRLENVESGAELVRTDLTGDQYFDETGVHFASLVRKGPGWEYVAVADGSQPYHATLSNFANANVPLSNP